jgi:aryl-alcohol dehydrogenase-like predicted oxidoreductase
MEHRRLGKSELNVSVIGMGTWPIGGSFWGPSDDTQAIAAIQKAIDSGLNLIDTAPVYGNGHSERLVAKAIKGRRQQVIIATKCGLHFKGSTSIYDLKPESIRKELEASLKRLGTDVIDLYQYHWPDPKTPIEETIGEMAKMKAEGKIRAIGVSNFDAALTQQAQKVAPIASNQVPYSMLNREIENELVPFCKEQNIGILAYGPLGGGILSGKYKEKPKFRRNDARNFFYNYYEEPFWSKAQALLKELEKIAERHDKPIAQLAINWVRQQPGISSALVGARNPQQAEANAAAGSWQLSPEELTAINKALSRIFSEKS